MTTAVVVASACSSGSTAALPTVPLVVDVPGPGDPWTSAFLTNGARLAVAAHPTVTIGGTKMRVVVQVVADDEREVTTMQNAEDAVAAHAVAFFSNGDYAPAVASITDPAGMPAFVLANGGVPVPLTPGSSLVRIAPTDDVVARRLADYLAADLPAPQLPTVGLLQDTSETLLADASAKAFATDGIRVVAGVPRYLETSTVAGSVAGLRAAGATVLVVRASGDLLAQVVLAARSAGWAVPVIAGPTAEDPRFREELKDHPEYVDGVRFASFRPTAEVGPAPFAAYRATYEKMFGPDLVTGVTSGGKQVVSPPDWAMLTSDAVRLTLTALDATHALGAPLLTKLTDGSLTIVGANGDQRGFTPASRESVSSGDVYFAAFHGMTYASVTDDPLQDVVPTLPQTR